MPISEPRELFDIVIMSVSHLKAYATRCSRVGQTRSCSPSCGLRHAPLDINNTISELNSIFVWEHRTILENYAVVLHDG